MPAKAGISFHKNNGDSRSEAGMTTSRMTWRKNDNNF